MMPHAASHYASDTTRNDNGGNVYWFKKEMVDDTQRGCLSKFKSPGDNSNGFVPMSSQQGKLKLIVQERYSPKEADVGSWLRDEPADTSAGGFLLSGSGSAIGRNNFSGGPGGTDTKIELGGGHSFTDRSNGSPAYSTNGELSGLLAQLKATKIKESILLEGIQRLGGGQKGLRRLVRTILVWVHAKSQAQSAEPSNSHSELSSPSLDEFPWSNLDSGSAVDGSQGQSGQQQHQTLNHVHLTNRHSSSSPPLDLSCMMNSNSSGRDSDVNGSLCGLRCGDRGSGDLCGQVQPNFESQPPVSSFIGLQPEGSSPGAAGVHKDVLSGDWVPPYMHKSHGNRMIRKLSPSSDSSGIQSVTHDFISFDEAVAEQQGKIRRHSPSSAGYSSSSQNSSVTNEFPAYVTSSTSPVSEVLGTAGIFGVPGANPFAPGGPFSISPSSPPPTDTHSLDFNAFNAQASILVDENLGLGSGCSAIDRFGSLGCPLSSEHSFGRKPTSARLGVVSKSKATPAACTRLARKQRMDRNRKAALYQVNRVAFETNGLVSGKSGGTCSPGSLRNTSRSQPATDCRTIDRRDQENLQFLLMKVLRPSDVGNLGRIVLPKKDAESHLPWLGAREGIQFTCEDYDTGEIMALRYRFWPNNKSRMYLLENTGDFVKKHHLQESDRMLIYRSQPQGTYIIRARKAHDCVDSLPNLDHREDMNEDTKEMSEENSPGGPCSSGTSSLSGAESSQGAGHDGAPESCVSLSVIATSQDDLLNFADLPDAPMGEGTENLVRFPSLESFDVELLELAPVNKEEATSGVGKMKEEYEP